MKQLLILVFGITFSFSQASAKQVECQTWPTYYDDGFCNCGAQLKNLEITPPNGMKVMSACLSDQTSSPERVIDLSKEKISLDKRSDSGNISGTVYLSGNLIITGEVYVDEGPSGSAWFTPYWEFSKLNTDFSRELSYFKLLNDDELIPFKIDRDLLNKGCSRAPATIEIDGFRVLIGGTDEAGTYLVNTKVLHLDQYKPCAKPVP